MLFTLNPTFSDGGSVLTLRNDTRKHGRDAFWELRCSRVSMMSLTGALTWVGVQLVTSTYLETSSAQNFVDTFRLWIIVRTLWSRIRFVLSDTLCCCGVYCPVFSKIISLCWTYANNLIDQYSFQWSELTFLHSSLLAINVFEKIANAIFHFWRALHIVEKIHY